MIFLYINKALLDIVRTTVQAVPMTRFHRVALYRAFIWGYLFPCTCAIPGEYGFLTMPEIQFVNDYWGKSDTIWEIVPGLLLSGLI
jgi:hypothetical protein